jgi:hypothetical protein
MLELAGGCEWESEGGADAVTRRSGLMTVSGPRCAREFAESSGDLVSELADEPGMIRDSFML